MRVVGAVVFGAALVLLGACGKEQVAPPIVWHTLEEGEALARKEHKLLVIHFGAAYELASKYYDVETWPDPEVRAAMRDYIAVKVDCEDDEEPRVEELLRRFRIRGLATVLVYDEERGELARAEEYTRPHPMARFLTDARRRAAGR